MVELFDGEIVAIDLDNKNGVVKCRVNGLYNSPTIGDIPDKDLPNVYPLLSPNQNSFYSPKIGEHVIIINDRDNKMTPFYLAKSNLSDYLLNKMSNDYEGFKSIVIDDEEKLEVYYSRKDGIKIKLDKTHINIVDNEVFIDNGNRVLHVLDNMISLGKEKKSSEPATLGDKNVDALNSLADEIANLSNAIISFTTQQTNITGSVTYLAPLSPAYTPLLQAATNTLTKVQSLIKPITIPKTKSKKTSLD